METELENKRGKNKKRNLWILRILLSIYALLYLLLGSEEFVSNSWDIEHSALKILFAIFIIGYVISWKNELTSGVIPPNPLIPSLIMLNGLSCANILLLFNKNIRNMKKKLFVLIVFGFFQFAPPFRSVISAALNSFMLLNFLGFTCQIGCTILNNIRLFIELLFNNKNIQYPGNWEVKISYIFLSAERKTILPIII
jgi:hypothetical protein